MRPFKYTEVDTLSILVRNIHLPPGTSTGIQLKAIMALKQEYPLLLNPIIALNAGREYVFNDVSLDPDDSKISPPTPWYYQTLEGGIGKYTDFDSNNHKRGSKTVDTDDIPIVEPGMNSISYRHKGPNYALVTIRLEDVPQFGC